MSARSCLAVLAAVVLAGGVSCKKHSDDDHGPPVLPAPVEISFAPKGTLPIVVVTLNMSMSENVSLAAMQAMYAKVVTVNQSLWNITEGQVRIGRVRIRDNAHPGTKSQDYDAANFDDSADDIVVWAPADFNGPGIAFVAVPAGRNGHFMGLQTNVANTTFIHELGHFLFQLSWPPAPVLVDEYAQTPDDNACVMELTFTPLRWCYTDNHLSQATQPRSCWSQILIDYPAFTAPTTHTAPAPPPDPDVEYTDVP